MNKARRKTYKRGTAKRLVRESFILSSTRFVSSRFVRFFESGFASPLLGSVKTVDNFARDKVTGPVFRKLGVRKNFAMPARNAVASFLSHSRLVKIFASLRSAFLNTSLRTVGIFLFTFGIYAAAIFLLKSYVSLRLGSAANVDDLSGAAIIALVGLILTAFGEKSIISAIGNSRILGSLISRCLGVNDSSLDRYSSASSGTAIGFGFLLGSLFGISTLFFSPTGVLLALLGLLTFSAIFHIPEFGLLLAVSTFSFLPADIIAAIAAVTLVSYLLKCIRLKRNFRFGSADAVVLLMFAVTAVACIASDGGVARGELYLLCFYFVYFLAKNLLCSEKLVVQTFDALCIGGFLGMALYIIGDFATLIPHEHLRSAALLLSSHTLDADMLVMLVATSLPFALSSYSSVDGRRSRKWFLLFTIAGAVIVDSMPFYVMLLVSLFIYIATAYKAPMGALLGAAVVIPPVIAVASEYTLASAVAFGARTTYDTAFDVSGDAVFANFWSGMYDVGGAVSVALFVGALLLISQRIFGATVGNSGNRVALYGGTVAASALVMVVCGFLFNPFSDLRMLVAVWFILGLCGAFYNVSERIQKDGTEV